MLKAIIFDMDGVLIDTPKFVWESFRILLSKYGANITNEQTKKYLGMSLKDQLVLLRRDFKIKEEIDVAEFGKKSFKIQLEMMKDKIGPNEILTNFLKQARDNEIKLAVATSSLKERAHTLLDLLEIKEEFDTIVTAEDIANHKPAPDQFLKATEILQIAPENCVVIEDAPNGIEAAKKGNIKAVGLITSMQPAENLNDADLIINSLSELTLEKLNSLF